MMPLRWEFFVKNGSLQVHYKLGTRSGMMENDVEASNPIDGAK